MDAMYKFPAFAGTPPRRVRDGDPHGRRLRHGGSVFGGNSLPRKYSPTRREYFVRNHRPAGCPVRVLFEKGSSIAPMRRPFLSRKGNILASWRPNLADGVQHPRRGNSTLSVTEQVSLQQPVPEGDFPYFCWRPRVGVRPFPSLVRGPPAEMAVGPDRAVPIAELVERLLDPPRMEDDEVRVFLERPEEPLDPPVLPGAVDPRPAVAYPQDPEAEPEELGCEHALVVREDDSRLVVPLERGDQRLQQRDRGLVRDAPQRDTQARPVVYDAEDCLRPALRIFDPRHVHSPDDVPRHRLRHPVLPFLPQPFRFVNVVTQDPVHEGLPDARSRCCSEVPVEDVGDLPHPGGGHVRLDAYDLPPDPCRLWLPVAAEDVRLPRSSEDAFASQTGMVPKGHERQQKNHQDAAQMDAVRGGCHAASFCCQRKVAKILSFLPGEETFRHRGSAEVPRLRVA